MAWNHKVTIKHLLTEDEDLETVRTNMANIADVLEKESCFSGFGYLSRFRNIPAADSIINPGVSPVDYANRLLALMYDYADRNRIWIN